ncbi:MAG: DUF1194 domain-containing protein [Alphaproteobacteria bacterium]|nr:DUF1194 domain-containing protein [Alphaproteobacteria bacterium]
MPVQTFTQRTGFFHAMLAAAMLFFASGVVTLAKDGPVRVDVELVLAVDVSYSMDPEEQRLQRDGYVQAITSPEFFKALKSGIHGKIAVAYMQWASSFDQDISVPWMLVDGPESARAFAEKLVEAPYRRARRTSISGAIDYAVGMFDKNGFHGLRRVIDVSGDGTNNDGRIVTEARDEAVRKGFIINGLPLLIRPSNWGFVDISNLDDYFRECVIGGPASFMIAIRDRSDFVRATRTKLVMEIASHDFTGELKASDRSLLMRRVQDNAPRVNCTVGEQMWRDRWGR